MTEFKLDEHICKRCWEVDQIGQFVSFHEVKINNPTFIPEKGDELENHPMYRK